MVIPNTVPRSERCADTVTYRYRYFETFFACTRVGAVLVLLNYAYAEAEMLALLKIVRKFQQGTSHSGHR